MNKKQFLLCFKKKGKASDPENNVVTSATEDISKAELALVKDEIQKYCSRPQKYQKSVPGEIKERGWNVYK